MRRADVNGAAMPTSSEFVDYPKPRAPNLPVASFGLCMGAETGVPAAITDVGPVLFSSSGRAAIGMALRAAELTAPASVLLPAYHCLSMVEPVQALGLTPVFYAINPDLSVDMQDLTSKLDASTRAVLAVHYFGFAQNLKPLRTLCDTHDLILIEDCAHAFFGDFEDGPPGARGDYAIASMTKFFAVADGGCLVSAHRSLDGLALRRRSTRSAIKAALNSLERSMNYRRLRPISWFLNPLVRLKDLVWGWVKASRRRAASSRDSAVAVDGAPDQSTAFDLEMTSWSRSVFQRTSQSRLVSRRRRHFRAFLAAFRELPGCRPVFAELPEGVVPYVFGLVIDDPDRVFPVLKRQGIPIFRWEDLAYHGCATSNAYSQRLLQFPCHQELRDAEVQWMIDAVRASLGE